MLGKILITIFSLPFLLIAFVLIGIKTCEVRNSYLDNEVQELCDTDPEVGVTIYETRTISKGTHPFQFDAYGNFKLPSKTGSNRGDADYYYQFLPREFIREGSPQIFRSEYRIMEASTNIVLSKSVSYRREGGHFYASWLAGGKSFHCPNTAGTVKSDTLLLENEI